jgi:hypothetical protein
MQPGRRFFGKFLFFFNLLTINYLHRKMLQKGYENVTLTTRQIMPPLSGFRAMKFIFYNNLPFGIIFLDSEVAFHSGLKFFATGKATMDNRNGKIEFL